MKRLKSFAWEIWLPDRPDHRLARPVSRQQIVLLPRPELDPAKNPGSVVLQRDRREPAPQSGQNPRRVRTRTARRRRRRHHARTPPRIEGAIRPLLEFLRSTPGVALLPIAVIFLGIGDGMKIFMIALASMWPILLNTIDGVRSVEPVLLQVARSYRLTLADRVRFIYIPNAAPRSSPGPGCPWRSPPSSWWSPS